jgi:hypothetical protein
VRLKTEWLLPTRFKLEDGSFNVAVNVKVLITLAAD